MFKISVDYSDVMDLLDLGDQVKGAFDEIGSEIATAAYGHTVDLADKQLNTRKDAYVKALSISKDDNAWLLVLDAKAMWIEENVSPYNMKAKLLASPKAKQGKNGKYLIVPFKHDKGSAGSTLTQTVANAMSERGIPFGDIETDSNGEAKQGLLHKFDITTAPLKTHVGPGQGHGPINAVRQGNTGTPFLKGVRVYQNQSQDKAGNRKTERFIATFRTVSENSKAKWDHPGTEGVHILDQTYDYILERFETEWGNKIMSKISAKLGK